MEVSYKPYVPFCSEEKSKVYIVRLAPNEKGVELQWLGNESEYLVRIYKKGKEVYSASTQNNAVSVNGLEKNTTYSVCVESPAYKSNERLFVTGDYRGKVVNYLHPEDLQYEFSGRFLASPYIVRFKGDLYVITDCFRGGSQKGAFNLSLLFRSKDDGKTWEYITDLVPCFWPTLFVANGKLCTLAVTTEFGSLVVACSDDGEKWSDYTELIYGSGFLFPGPHKAPTPVLNKDGKLYFGIEYGAHSVKRFDSLIVSYDLSKNILDRNAWTISEKCKVEKEWGGDPDILFAIEGNVVERNGEIFNLLRFTANKALMLKYDEKNPLKAPSFYKVVDFKLGHCKFFIQRADDGTYYAMGNTTCYPRHIVELYKSKDLENWEKVKTLEDISNLTKENDGVQYPTFFIEGKKLYTVLRTALNGADTFHNSNAITFKIYDID